MKVWNVYSKILISEGLGIIKLKLANNFKHVFNYRNYGYVNVQCYMKLNIELIGDNYDKSDKNVLIFSGVAEWSEQLAGVQECSAPDISWPPPQDLEFVSIVSSPSWCQTETEHQDWHRHLRWHSKLMEYARS